VNPAPIIVAERRNPSAPSCCLA